MSQQVNVAELKDISIESGFLARIEILASEEHPMVLVLEDKQNKTALFIKGEPSEFLDLAHKILKLVINEAAGV